MSKFRVTVVDRIANAPGLPEYSPDNIAERLADMARRSHRWYDGWLRDGRPGLWRAGGYVLRRGWLLRRVHTRRFLTTEERA